MRLDTTKLGASMLASGPLLIQFVGDKRAWWVGMIFTVLGPFLMALKKERKHEH